MGRIMKGRCKRLTPTPYPIPSNRYALEKRDWEQAICPICLEVPHNSVLLLCASHDKGCRPYMCGTNFRHSNCLNLFKKAYTKPGTYKEPVPTSSFKAQAELLCPLCRGQVKGWTIVEPARRYLNKKKRICMQEGCKFIGKYRDLKKHVKAEHKLAKPRKVDPVLEAKWRALETQREQQDVISTIRASMPRSVVMGDYVIDMGSSGSDHGDEFDDVIGRNIFYYVMRNGGHISRIRRDDATHEDFGRRRPRRRQGRSRGRSEPGV